jgi:hypothetical protein
MLQVRTGLINSLGEIAREQIKKAFVDTGTAAAGAGADPAMAGMDPAMAGMGMDPAMAGGAPPPPPADPMAGGGADQIRQVIQQELANAGIGAKAIKPKPVEERVARVEHLLANIVDFMNIPVKATDLVDPLGMGPQEQGGGGAPPGGGGGGAPPPMDAGVGAPPMDPAMMAAMGGGGPPPDAKMAADLAVGLQATHDKAAAILSLARKRRSLRESDNSQVAE